MSRQDNVTASVEDLRRALSKRLVEMHGGRLWLESEVGKGSTFTFEIPLRRPAAHPVTA